MDYYQDENGEFQTMGEQEFATVGYDSAGQPVMGQMIRPGMFRPTTAAPVAPGGRAAPRMVVPVPMLRQAMQRQGPALLPAMRAAPPTMTDARVRDIVRDELDSSLPQWFRGYSKVPGASDASQLMSPLGLGVGTLTNAVSSVVLQAQPQRPFRGERLIVDLARTAGAAVVPVRISEFKIGENSQLVGSGALPAEAFDPAAFGVRLAMSPSAPGIVVLLRLETDVGAVPAGEAISVTAAIIGRALWGEAGGPC